MLSIADDHFGDFIRYYKGLQAYQNRVILCKPIVRYVEKEDIDFNMENTLYVSKDTQLNMYDNEECIVILDSTKFDTYQLMMLEKGKPYLTNYRKVTAPLIIIAK